MRCRTRSTTDAFSGASIIELDVEWDIPHRRRRRHHVRWGLLQPFEHLREGRRQGTYQYSKHLTLTSRQSVKSPGTEGSGRHSVAHSLSFPGWSNRWFARKNAANRNIGTTTRKKGAEQNIRGLHPSRGPSSLAASSWVSPTPGPSGARREGAPPVGVNGVPHMYYLLEGARRQGL